MDCNPLPFRQKLERAYGQQDELTKAIQSTRHKIRTLARDKGHIEEAQALHQTVAEMTQKELEYHVSELVTLALAAVFQDPYEFAVDFIQRRNRTECDLWFVRNKEPVKPMDAAGGGAVDVASFALRVSMWSLQQPRTRPLLVLDEPFKFVSKNYHEKASEMIKMISNRLGIQIIMVTHLEGLIECADTVFEVTQKKGVSYVSN